MVLLSWRRPACRARFQKLLQINAEDPCALALLGECQADLGDFEGAVRWTNVPKSFASERERERESEW